MDNVTIEKLKRMHGDKAESVFRQIADIGGFGNIGSGEGGLDPNYVGGLDIKGVIDPENKALSDSAKAKIAELSGASQRAAEAAKEAEAKKGK